MDSAADLARIRAGVSRSFCAKCVGAIYTDGYLLHRRDITSNQLWHDMVLAILLTAGTVWSFLRRHRSKRQLS